MQNQKKADPKKGHYRTSPLKNGLTKLPCFLKILASWGDFFDNGLLIYPFSGHTMQCCTRKPFLVAKLEPQSCSASAFPYFEADAELGVLPEVKSKIWKHLNGKYHFSAYWTISGIASLWGGGGTIFFKAPLIISSGIFFQQTLDLFYIIASIKLSKCFDQ